MSPYNLRVSNLVPGLQALDNSESSKVLSPTKSQSHYCESSNWDVDAASDRTIGGEQKECREGRSALKTITSHVGANDPRQGGGVEEKRVPEIFTYGEPVSPELFGGSDRSIASARRHRVRIHCLTTTQATAKKSQVTTLGHGKLARFRESHTKSGKEAINGTRTGEEAPAIQSEVWGSHPVQGKEQRRQDGHLRRNWRDESRNTGSNLPIHDLTLEAQTVAGSTCPSHQRLPFVRVLITYKTACNTSLSHEDRARDHSNHVWEVTINENWWEHSAALRQILRCLCHLGDSEYGPSGSPNPDVAVTSHIPGCARQAYNTQHGFKGPPAKPPAHAQTCLCWYSDILLVIPTGTVPLYIRSHYASDSPAHISLVLPSSLLHRSSAPPPESVSYFGHLFGTHTPQS
ncbi:hypothetical protein EI94DRAFT_1701602 [Lactarius quietus]|nr:hypothetical protein EI94DRAFT_1701602 [Lactarius quietus]